MAPRGAAFDRRIKAIKYLSDDDDVTARDPEVPAAEGDDRPSEEPSGSGSEVPRPQQSATLCQRYSRRNQLDSGDEATEFATLSFGLLAKAQDSLDKRRGSHHEAFVAVPGASPTRDIGDPEAAERKAGRNGTQEHARSSKHAPAELSSKKAVSRKREVLPTTKRDVRDPRFEPLTGPLDEQKAKKNYGFLNDYRDLEMSELRSVIRQTKDPAAKENLKRALLRMESRKKSQQRKDEEQDILRAHRAKEKELIRQGKKPFYLKKAEQKKLALVQRFECMKGKQADKAIERRRKKKASRHMREMPEGRRTVKR
ncbi:MAG: hypothetical protein LQ344_001481 [Seirophora lacunosa]|nr:MAG: hypothetical protein LQ344_001481 [Seirophora lacunosa]